MFELQSSYTFLASRLSAQLQEDFNRELSILKITWSQWLVLHCVNAGLADTPAAIASRLAISRSVVTRLLDRLEDKSLLERRSDRYDRRSVTVVISGAGAQLLEYMEDAARRHELDAGERLGEALLEELRNAVQRLESTSSGNESLGS